jgi:phosphopantetheine adenylyltransferase
MLLPKSTLELD